MYKLNKYTDLFASTVIINTSITARISKIKNKVKISHCFQSLCCLFFFFKGLKPYLIVCLFGL